MPSKCLGEKQPNNFGYWSVITSDSESQVGTVVEWLKPFTFKVRLKTGEVILCGLMRSYFGRILPKQALKQLEKHGPHVGDEVSVRVSSRKSGGMRQGVILRNTE